MFCFKEAYCGIQSELITIGRMCSESLHVNLVEHDVNVKVLLVVVRNDHELMAFITAPAWPLRAPAPDLATPPNLRPEPIP